MPLHGYRKAGGPPDAKCLDEAIGSARLDLELRPEALDTLGMEGIHTNPLAISQGPQQAARLENHIVSGTVLDLQRLTLVIAMVAVAGNLVHLLVQGA